MLHPPTIHPIPVFTLELKSRHRKGLSAPDCRIRPLIEALMSLTDQSLLLTESRSRSGISSHRPEQMPGLIDPEDAEWKPGRIHTPELPSQVLRTSCTL